MIRPISQESRKCRLTLNAANPRVERWSAGRRPDGKLPMPVYLTAELEDCRAAAALRRGESLSDVLNDLLAREISIVEAVK